MYRRFSSVAVDGCDEDYPQSGEGGGVMAKIVVKTTVNVKTKVRVRVVVRRK